MGAVIEYNHKYAAFISYAHADEAAARKLHNRLETYPLPKGMDASERAKLVPIFRDVTELTAHHSLSEKIRDAVKTSRFLIVLCSPAAKASHWVNEEIRLFRSLHGEGAILAVIVDGEPDTAFPPALLEDGREPLAADISGKEGFKFGVTQLAASMLGVGLDTLVQRDQRRRRFRTQIVSGATTALALIMGALAWNAVDARDEAEVSRNEAEKMVEFMIKDLKEDLDPIGKLEILNGVGERVAAYYDAIPITDMDNDRLGRRARARHLLGEVALDQGKYDKAEAELKGAYDATEEILKRHPDDGAAIFNHAQSAYWMGELFNQTKKYEKTLVYWNNYDELAQELLKLDSEKLEWIMEAGWGANNLGLVNRKLNFDEISIQKYDRAAKIFGDVNKSHPNNRDVAIPYINVLAGKSNQYSKMGETDLALETRQKQIDQLELFKVQIDHDDTDINYRLIKARLNYWELKNEQSRKCEYNQHLEILNEFESFLTADSTNYKWKRNFVIYKDDFLNLCFKSLPKDELNYQLLSLITFFNTHIKKDDLESRLLRLKTLLNKIQAN